MPWKVDNLKPSQPYFVFDTIDFCQEVYLKQGISHFFTYRLSDETQLRIVPDGCIDLFFEYGNGHIQGYACGTRLEFTRQALNGSNDIFGVRFMPGIRPAILDCTMKDILDNKIPIEQVQKSQDTKWLEKLACETDFYKRIKIFLEEYTRAEQIQNPPYGKSEIVQTVKQMIYDSDGVIKVHQLSDNTGYSERYINRIFTDEMGFSPKTFCKIIQFQRALEYLNYGAPSKMTNAAVSLGYYDQSQFIRDFTKYAGITPKKYLDMVNKLDYRERITDYTKLYKL